LDVKQGEGNACPVEDFRYQQYSDTAAAVWKAKSEEAVAFNTGDRVRVLVNIQAIDGSGMRLVQLGEEGTVAQFTTSGSTLLARIRFDGKGVAGDWVRAKDFASLEKIFTDRLRILSVNAIDGTRIRQIGLGQDGRLVQFTIFGDICLTGTCFDRQSEVDDDVLVCNKNSPKLVNTLATGDRVRVLDYIHALDRNCIRRVEPGELGKIVQFRTSGHVVFARICFDCKSQASEWVLARYFRNLVKDDGRSEKAVSAVAPTILQQRFGVQTKDADRIENQPKDSSEKCQLSSANTDGDNEAPFLGTVKSTHVQSHRKIFKTGSFKETPKKVEM